VAEPLEVLRDPLALGRRLEQDARARAPAEEGGEPLAWRANPLLQHDRAGGVLDADLGFLLVHVHAHMVHGWPPLRCGNDRVR